MKYEQMKLFPELNDKEELTDQKFLDINFNLKCVCPSEHKNTAIAVLYKNLNSINSCRK